MAKEKLIEYNRVKKMIGWEYSKLNFLLINELNITKRVNSKKHKLSIAEKNITGLLTSHR
jgi:hypothetical protein